MAGSHSVNGVAALHSELVKTTLAPEFHKLYPERFNNKTNGVTPRRWLLHANRPLASLITQRHRRRLDHAISTSCARLELFVDDAGLLERLETVKSRNKLALAQLTKELTGIVVDPEFDVRRAGQAHARVQAATAQHPARRSTATGRSSKTASSRSRRARSSSPARRRRATSWPS